MLNSNISQEFTDKIHEANQLYKEALLSFLPESAKGHLLTIQAEFSALAKDCLMYSVFTHGTSDSHSKTQGSSHAEEQGSAYTKTEDPAETDSHGTNKVKKVIID